MADAAGHRPLLNPNLADGEFIAVLYTEVYGRAPDAQGLAYWQQQLNNGVSRKDVIFSLVDSSEYNLQAPTIDKFVQGMYHHLLGRDGDAGGIFCGCRP